MYHIRLDYFDNKIIQKYHIDRRMIPNGAVIINVRESFFVKYKKYMKNLKSWILKKS